MGHYAFVVVGLFLGTIVLLLMASVVHGKIGIPPNLPLQYQGSGNTLQTLLNLSWPAAQGVGSTFTFFAPANSAVKKYPCLFDQKEKTSKDIATATNVLQYHIIPGKAFTYLELHDIAISSNYMSSTALNGKKLYITGAGTKINGYSTINSPDIGVLETQTIHGISSLLAPPGLVVSETPQKVLHTQLVMYPTTSR
ncbi:unnamed protein product [Sphagnum troendelagicum]